MRGRQILAEMIAVLLLMGWLATSAIAKGPPAKILISGPGIAGDKEFAEAKMLEKIGLGGLEDFSPHNGSWRQPSDLRGTGFVVTRYMQNGAAKLFAFDRLRYYPDQPGGRDAIFYEGIIGGGSEYDGKWFYATNEEQTAMREILAVLVPAQAKVSTLPTAGLGGQNMGQAEPFTLFVLAGLILAGMVAAFGLLVQLKNTIK